MLTYATLANGTTIAVEAVEPTLGNTVVELVSLGFLGFAAATSLIGALVIMNSTRASDAQMKTGRLWLMLSFANVLIGAGIHMWDTREGGSVIVSFSPRFANAALPEPYIMVGPGKWTENQVIDIRRDRHMLVYVDAIDVMKEKSATQQQTIALMSAQLAARGGLSAIDDGGQ